MATSSALAQAPERDRDDAELVARIAEYDGLLAQTLPLDQALCMDDQLAAWWPVTTAPSPAQWHAMLIRAMRAQEQCASAGGETERAAGAIRKGMALQVERKRALEQARATMRACAARYPTIGGAPGCDAPEDAPTFSPTQWARIVRARLLGQQ